MTIREMLARREAIRTEMAALHAATPSGELPTEARTKWDGLETELRSLDGSMSRQARLDELDRAAPGTPVDGGDPRFAELRSGLGILAALRAQLPGHGDTHEAGRVREVSQEIERRTGRKAEGVLWDMRQAPRATEHRTVTSGRDGTTPNGAALVPTLLDSANFIDRLRDNLVVRRLGARVLSDLSGNIDIPRRTGSVTVNWVGEDQPIPLSDPSFDKVSLRPRHAGALTELSRNMILQSSPDVEQLVQDDMAKELAQALDLAAIDGSAYTQPDGSALPAGSPLLNQPIGILTQLPASARFPVVGTPTWDDVVNLLGAFALDNSSPNAWAENPAMRSLLMRTPKHPTQSNGYIQEDPNNLLGLPVLASNNVPGLILGDWTQVLIGFWSELDILVNPYAAPAYAKGNVQVRAMMTCDVAVRNPGSFAAYGSPAAS